MLSIWSYQLLQGTYICREKKYSSMPTVGWIWTVNSKPLGHGWTSPRTYIQRPVQLLNRGHSEMSNIHTCNIFLEIDSSLSTISGDTIGNVESLHFHQTTRPLVGFFRLSGRKDLPRYPRSRHAWSLPSNVPSQASGSMDSGTAVSHQCKQHGINRLWKIQFLNISSGYEDL